VLDLRPGCEHCDRNLPPDREGAWICTFECTWCTSCAATLAHVCPNCGGDLQPRPRRPSGLLPTYPATTERVHKPRPDLIQPASSGPGPGSSAPYRDGVAVHGIDGFEYEPVVVGQTAYRPGRAGSGPPVLLLHGFPQTHHCWRLVAPRLTGQSTVVVCDLKGYGESRSAPGGPLGEGYAKREMASELVEVMARLGFDRFSVVGHDRGGRVAYRMALDHPQVVRRLAVLNVIPTVDQFERMTPETALDYLPFFLLAQPPEVSERVVGASAAYLARHFLTAWAAHPDAAAPDAVEHYVDAFTPEAITRICAEYRAAFHLDRPLDAADRAAGRRIECPVLVHWGAEEGGMSNEPLDIWRRWADDVEGSPLDSGHFIPEEAPEALGTSLRGFLG